MAANYDLVVVGTRSVSMSSAKTTSEKGLHGVCLCVLRVKQWGIVSRLV